MKHCVVAYMKHSKLVTFVLGCCLSRTAAYVGSRQQSSSLGFGTKPNSLAFQTEMIQVQQNQLQQRGEKNICHILRVGVFFDHSIKTRICSKNKPCLRAPALTVYHQIPIFFFFFV